MAALIRLAAPLLIAIAGTAGATTGSAASPTVISPTVERWRPMIAEASRRFGVPQAWIAAVMEAESRGLTQLDGRPITSHAGAMGLMQLMPGTWDTMRRQHRLGPDPHDPHDNIVAGAAYLRAMYDRFGYPGLFAAYNAGPARYTAHLRRHTPLPEETRSYIAQLARAPATPLMPPTILSGTRLFFMLKTSAGALAKQPKTSPGLPLSDRLFVPLTQVQEGRY